MTGLLVIVILPILVISVVWCNTIATFNLYRYVSSLLFLIKPLPAVKIDTDIELGRKGESTEIGTTETGVANKEDKNARPGLISVPRDNQLNYVHTQPINLNTHSCPTNQPARKIIDQLGFTACAFSAV